MHEPIDVLLSTDVGAEMDDQWAIAHLALSPRVNLLGIVTTHTPYLTAQRSAELAREVLSHLPVVNKPPVIPGSSTPLESRTKPQRNEGIDFIIETARQYSQNQPLILLTIGAATDAASVLLLEPFLAERMRIVSMAFHSVEQGGREFNVQNDPKAWQVILDAPVPLTIGPAVTCMHDLLMPIDRARELFDGCGQAGEYLIGLLQWWLETQPKVVEGVTGRGDAWPIWDEIVTAHLLGWTDTETLPRPYLLDSLDFEFAPREGHLYPAVKWIKGVDSQKLWSDFVRLLR
ncbi:MAG: nucleoside hydrolase [Armatimonadota bacterium]|nr:nucleoside hydrolase [bacterium]MDW8319865.1 nucleoside hydrolase [Armatimonadota bacterium]